MKKLNPTNNISISTEDVIEKHLNQSSSLNDFINAVKNEFQNTNIEFYDNIVLILKHIGFSNAQTTRAGDVNCRFDATIIDENNSIPIEIKSPGEDEEINIKAIRQACENKIVLLSRKSYRTKDDTTSLAIAFEYPPERSDVYELIEDIKCSFNISIGIIDISDLLKILYGIKKDNKTLNIEYFNTLQGKFDYEKAFSK